MDSNKKTKRTTKKSTARKKSSLKDLNQSHGKVENEKGFQPTTLDQVWGDTGIWKYDTMDANEYETKIRNMPKVDLQSHASKVGIIPVDNREVLATRLVREFKKHVTLYKQPQDKTLGKVHSKEDITEAAKKILNEGR